MQTTITLEKIYKSSFKFLASTELEKTYEVIVKEAVKLIHGQYGSVLLEKDGEFKRVYTTVPQSHLSKIRKKGFSYQVFKTNKPLIVPFSKIVKNHPEMSSMKAVSDLIIPLSYQDKPIGTLAIISKINKTFTKQDLKTLLLFGRLATLAIVNSELNDDNKKALEMRDLFISMASHELKTPITTVYGYLQLIDRKLKKGEAIQPKWIDIMLKEANRLTRLINELLQANQINKGVISYEWSQCNIQDIIEQSLSNFKFRKFDQVVEVKNKLSPSQTLVNGDNDKLVQVITNLLNNSAKNSSFDSKITLILESKNRNVTIKVIDRGKGIPEENLPHIFDRFYRGNNNTHEGMGLGLYIAKKIVDEHKGKIFIHSKLEQGTTVEIHLPIRNTI